MKRDNVKPPPCLIDSWSDGSLTQRPKSPFALSWPRQVVEKTYNYNYSIFLEVLCQILPVLRDELFSTYYFCACGLFLGCDPNSSMRSTDQLLFPSASPVPGRHCVVANGSAGGNSSSSTEDLPGDYSYHDRKSTFVQHLSGSLSRAFKRTRNRKSLEFASELYF